MPNKTINRALSVAPMMAYTDRHFRRLVRFYSRRTLLYTEMVVTGTILNHKGETYLDDLLGLDELANPVAAQLGGDDPAELAECAQICEQYGYDEINLNVGCPSPRVQKGQFGVCLMGNPKRVANAIRAMSAAVRIPVTVKHRIGFDDQDSYVFMADFVKACEDAGAQTFIVHARKAWLKGLNPAQNRSVPPLRYEEVYRLKHENPHLEVIINGGIESLDQAEAQLAHVDGVMIGRAAYHNPEMFGNADSRFFNAADPEPMTEMETLARVDNYLTDQVEKGVRPSAVLKHCLGLFKGRKGSRLWRQHISAKIQGIEPERSLAEIYGTSIGAESGSYL